MNAVKSFEFTPENECFENTNVAKLTIEADGDWLQLSTPLSVTVDQEMINVLNKYVNQTQRGDTTHEAYLAKLDKYHNKQRKAGLPDSPPTTHQIVRMATTQFYKAIGAYDNDSPLWKALPELIRSTNLPAIISNTRLFYAYSGENLPYVLEISHANLHRKTESLERKFSLLESNNISIIKVLLGNPNILGRKDAGPNQEKFLQEARDVGNRSFDSVTKRLARAANFQAEITTATVQPSAEPITAEMQTFYEAVADTAYLERSAVINYLSRFAYLDEQQRQAYLAKLDVLIDEKDDIKLSDLSRLID